MERGREREGKRKKKEAAWSKLKINAKTAFNQDGEDQSKRRKIRKCVFVCERERERESVDENYDDGWIVKMG